MSTILDLPAYLARIAHPMPASADLATLRGLHLAHTLAIPFENLDIQRGLPVALDLASLQAKLVRARRGGYCFEHNALFAAVLELLGFRVTRLCGRVRMGRPGGLVPPRTHMVLRVELEDGPYLADVGFGAGQLLYPLPLRPGATDCQHGWDFALATEGEALVLRGRQPEGWIDLYIFTLEPQHPIDYEVANHYTSTHPESGFVRSLTAQRVTPELRHLLRNRTYDPLRPGTRVRREIADPEELLRVLADSFGLSFPPGTMFNRPSFDEP